MKFKNMIFNLIIKLGLSWVFNFSEVVNSTKECFFIINMHIILTKKSDINIFKFLIIIIIFKIGKKIE